MSDPPRSSTGTSRGGPSGGPVHGVIGIGKGDGSAVAENDADFLYGDKKR